MPPRSESESDPTRFAKRPAVRIRVAIALSRTFVGKKKGENIV